MPERIPGSTIDPTIDVEFTFLETPPDLNTKYKAIVDTFLRFKSGQKSISIMATKWTRLIEDGVFLVRICDTGAAERLCEKPKGKKKANKQTVSWLGEKYGVEVGRASKGGEF
jgi:hypothetical protein